MRRRKSFSYHVQLRRHPTASASVVEVAAVPTNTVMDEAVPRTRCPQVEGRRAGVVVAAASIAGGLTTAVETSAMAGGQLKCTRRRYANARTAVGAAGDAAVSAEAVVAAAAAAARAMAVPWPWQ